MNCMVVVALAFNPSTWEAEAGGAQCHPGQPGSGLRAAW